MQLSFLAGSVPGLLPLSSFPIRNSFEFRTSDFELLYCLSYSPLPKRLNTLNPAFFASEIETVFGELNVDQIRRTGFLHAGQFVSGFAERGRRNVNFPPHTGQPPSQTSYSYNGIAENPKFEVRNSKQVGLY